MSEIAIGKRIGEVIRRLRKRNDLQLGELAERAGIPGPSLTQIELGNVASPGIGTIQKIAVALGITVSELLRESPIETAPIPNFEQLSSADQERIREIVRLWVKNQTKITPESADTNISKSLNPAERLPPNIG